MARGMKFIFQHYIVNGDGEPDEPGIAVHVIINGLQGYHIGFFSQDIAYHDCGVKTYEGMHAVVVKVFSQDKFETPSKTHPRMVHANYGCDETMIISGDNQSKNKMAHFFQLWLNPSFPQLRRNLTRKK